MFQEMLQTLPQVIIDGLTLGSVYAVVALGYTMVYGILQLINFAHGEIFMTGAYIGTAVLLIILGMGFGSSIPSLLLLIIALVITALCTGLLGMGIERVAYRPVRRAPRLVALITAVGVSFILQDVVRIVAEILTGNYIVTGPSLFSKQITIPVSSFLSVFNDASLKVSFFIVLICPLV